MLADLAAFGAAMDALIYRADGGRWGAGLVRRAASILILLARLGAILMISLREQARHARSRVAFLRDWRDLVRPPARWAAA